MPEIDLTDKKLEIKYLHIAALTNYENNAKKHPRSQIDMLKLSISEFGFKNPVVVDRNKIIVAGHGRVMAAKELGMVEVPCIIADDLNDIQIQEYRLMDNKSNESAWDFDMLKTDLFSLKEKGFDIKFTGFDASIFNKFPTTFKEQEFDESIPTKNKCPKCGYNY